MRTICLIACLKLVFFAWSASAGEDYKYPIYHHISGYEITNTWFVTKSRFEKIPGWDEKGEPPLPVGKAISLAKAWIISKGGSTNSYVVTVEFHSMARGAPPGSPSEFRPLWFYTIRFQEVYQFGSSMTCVVLLDGSLVEPESEPQTTNTVRYLD